MLWNWQLSDWPAFSFDAALLREAEERFLKGAGVVVGSMHHLDGDARQGIVIELISQEMVDSSAIEGEVLDRASVQSSIARQLGFVSDKRRSNPAEAGAAELMADLYRRYAQPLTDEQLFRSEEHTSELPVTNAHLVCRLLLEKKKNTTTRLTKSNK